MFDALIVALGVVGVGFSIAVKILYFPYRKQAEPERKPPGS